jgi:hypothetical protein
MQLITLTIWCGTGANFSERSNGYTHAMIARLPSGLFKLKLLQLLKPLADQYSDFCVR